jgi:hypothetical protein
VCNRQDAQGNQGNKAKARPSPASHRFATFGDLSPTRWGRGVATSPTQSYSMWAALTPLPHSVGERSRRFAAGEGFCSPVPKTFRERVTGHTQISFPACPKLWKNAPGNFVCQRERCCLAVSIRPKVLWVHCLNHDHAMLRMFVCGVIAHVARTQTLRSRLSIHQSRCLDGAPRVLAATGKRDPRPVPVS